MKKNNLRDFTKKTLPQMIIQTVVILLSAFMANMFMSWIVTMIFHVTNPYLAATYQSLGTLIITTLIIVPINTLAYQKRVEEITILSEYINKVASGDYECRIPIRPREQMTPVYENFNKMCAELGSVQMLRNDFINSYSHEFKTPIASINGFASLILEADCSEEEKRQYLNIIKEESERLSNLAKNTILLSKLSTQQAIADEESYNLGEQLRQCAIILSPEWMEKEIDFSSDFPDVSFLGNKELLQHLWLNIMGNSIKYTQRGGQVVAELTEQEDSVVVCIRDNGEGMDEVTKEHLFDPYFQGDSSHSSKGLGLGLAIAHEIIELYHGKIQVESQKGQGSKFIITLPNKSKKPEKPQPQSPAQLLFSNVGLGKLKDSHKGSPK